MGSGDDIETYAASIKPAFTVSTRRRLTAVESSSSVRVREVESSNEGNDDGGKDATSLTTPFPWLYIVVAVAVCSAFVGGYTWFKKGAGHDQKGIPVVATRA